MDITNDNFINNLPEICETIQDCDFIAIDTELSGLMRERSQNRCDHPEERFCRAITSSRGYFIMQFGLSCFTKIDDHKYSNKTYNFYIFPQQFKTYGDINRTLSIQAHAIQFLSEHNFDFNKLFKHGVSYLTFEEKKLLTAKLKLEAKNRSTALNHDGLPGFVPSSMMAYCKDSIKKVQTFVTEAKKMRNISKDVANETSQSFLSGSSADRIVGDTGSIKKGPTMEIRDCMTCKRRDTLRDALECLPISDNIYIEIETDKDTNKTFLLIEYVDKITKDERNKYNLKAAKGFLEVIETIILNKKPIVGHNLLLDLVQIINQFVGQLEDNYSYFKETCHSLFPMIYDTKYIAHSILDPETLTQNQSRLNDLYCQLSVGNSFPKVQIDHLGPFFDEKQTPHQAGYDAYMSGFSFIVLCEAYLREMRRYDEKSGFAGLDSKSIAHQTEVISNFSNKIYLSFSNDYKCYDLSGDEVQSNQNHAFK